MFYTRLLLLLILIISTSACQKKSVPIEVRQSADGNIAIKLISTGSHEYCINFFTVYGHDARNAPPSQILLSDIYLPEPCAKEAVLKRDGHMLRSAESEIEVSQDLYISFHARSASGHPGQSAVYLLREAGVLERT